MNQFIMTNLRPNIQLFNGNREEEKHYSEDNFYRDTSEGNF